MAFLEGMGTAFAPAAATPNQATGSLHAPTTAVPNVIDGTPVRVVVLALSAAAGLAALHMAGFRFALTASA